METSRDRINHLLAIGNDSEAVEYKLTELNVSHEVSFDEFTEAEALGIIGEAMDLMVHLATDKIVSILRGSNETWDDVNKRKIKMLVETLEEPYVEHGNGPDREGFDRFIITVKAGTLCYIFEDELFLVILTKNKVTTENGELIMR